MQVPGAIRLRPHDLAETLWRLPHQHGIIQHTGRMDDAPQRRHPGQRPTEQALHLRLIRDIACGHCDVGAHPLQISHEILLDRTRCVR